MSIKKNSKIGGVVVVSSIAVTILVAAFSINEIRFGGPLYRADRQASDLVADILPPPAFIVEPYLEASLIADADGRLSERMARMEALRKAYEERKAYWAGQDIPDDIKVAFASAEVESDRFWSTYQDKFVPAVRAGDKERVEAAHAELGAEYDKHRQLIDALVAKALDHQTKLADSTGTILGWTIAVVALMASAIMAMVAVAVWYLQKKILGPVTDTVDTMNRMAAGDHEAGRTYEHRGDEIGDMTRSIEVFREAAIAQTSNQEKQKVVVESLSKGLDELAKGNLVFRINEQLAPEYEALRVTFNRTLDELGDLMQSVSSSAQSVATGASEIRAASDDLALRNEQQAASLEETAAAMNHVTSNVGETARGATSVQHSIGEAHQEATDGGAVVERAVAAMAAIERSAQEITQIINVIDGIAFQTNLLALNAGVEAARAGDAGKGFAVVANEVRALAQRSADAAKDIKELITASSEQVSGGVRLVGETGELLQKIVMRVGEINDKVRGIAQSTESQSTNLQQVNTAVAEMDRMTQHNAAMVEESTAAARSLAQEANQLTGLVSRFRTSAASNAPTAVTLPSAAARRKTVSRQPVVAGNLAMKIESTSDDDWTEF